VAVASKFLAVGAYVPAADPDAGALATQAYGNQALKHEGLELLKDGLSPGAMLELFLSKDGQKEERQVGAVDKNGRAATYTGSACSPWAGGRAEEHPDGSFAAQGNLLAGEHVIDAMITAWFESKDEPFLARRLVHALNAGQDAGGDPRGKQAAAVLVVEKNGGYGGLSDIVVDLRSDDSSEPIQDLMRMIDLHELYFGTTPEHELLDFTDVINSEVKTLLAQLGYTSGNIPRDLYSWMGRENFEERWHEDKIDPIVLDQLRKFAA
jgi:uncharacterized Ntn-hydrolase superfamily protein